MTRKRVVITGLGVISSNAIGKEAFSDALFKGTSGIKPISLFDTRTFKVKTAGEIADFTAEKFLGAKGLRTQDRSTKLVSSAAKLALDDASLEISEQNSHDIGVVIGTTLGSVQSISDFDKDALKDGPRYVNPAFFPNTVINSPAGQVSIRYNIKGFNTTISTGFSASLDAINYALDFIKLGRAKIVLTGGVEELCIQTFLGFYKTGFLAGLKEDSLELSCPFDKRRNGIIFGEGSSIVTLEELESAINRKVRIYAEVLGFGMSFEPKVDGLQRAMLLAMQEAKIQPEDIDYICSGANSSINGDLDETRAIKNIFGENAKKVYISSVKSMLGECFSASGALGLGAAVCTIDKQIIPPTINYEEKDENCDLNYVVNKAKTQNINKVMVNAFGPTGCNSSLIISRFAG